MDTASLLIVCADGLLAAQGRATYRMGLRLLADLTHALRLRVDPEGQSRLTEVDISAVRAALELSAPDLQLGTEASNQLVKLVRRYDGYLQSLSTELAIPLPPWIAATNEREDTDTLDLR